MSESLVIKSTAVSGSWYLPQREI